MASSFGIFSPLGNFSFIIIPENRYLTNNQEYHSFCLHLSYRHSFGAKKHNLVKTFFFKSYLFKFFFKESEKEKEIALFKVIFTHYFFSFLLFFYVH